MMSSPFTLRTLEGAGSLPYLPLVSAPARVGRRVARQLRELYEKVAAAAAAAICVLLILVCVQRAARYARWLRLASVERQCACAVLLLLQQRQPAAGAPPTRRRRCAKRPADAAPVPTLGEPVAWGFDTGPVRLALVRHRGVAHRESGEGAKTNAGTSEARATD